MTCIQKHILSLVLPRHEYKYIQNTRDDCYVLPALFSFLLSVHLRCSQSVIEGGPAPGYKRETEIAWGEIEAAQIIVVLLLLCYFCFCVSLF